MTALHSRRRKSRDSLSVAAAALLGALALWSFSRCAALPNGPCLDDDLSAAPADMLSPDGCRLCICDAAGELHCLPGPCPTDAGPRIDEPQ